MWWVVDEVNVGLSIAGTDVAFPAFPGTSDGGAVDRPGDQIVSDQHHPDDHRRA